MYESDLVCIHETWIAHHVAAVGEVHGQDGAAAVQNSRTAVIMKLLVVVGADIATGEHLFEVLEERRVDGHHVFKVAMDWAVLDHDDLAVLLEDGRLDLADLLVEEDADIFLAVENRLPRFARAVWA